MTFVAIGALRVNFVLFVSFQFISGTRVDHKQLEKTMTAAFLLETIFISQ